LALEKHAISAQVPAVGFERICGQAFLYPTEIEEVGNVVRQQSLATGQRRLTGLWITHPKRGIC